MLALNYPHIEKQDDQPARFQRLPRIRVAQIVMDYLAYGWSVEEISCHAFKLLVMTDTEKRGHGDTGTD